jgi:hypothetical protein
LLVQLGADALTVMLAGHAESTGGCVSLTVTVKLQPEVLPFPSLAVQFTVVVPRLNAVPLAGEQLIPGELQLSVALTV